MRRRSVTVLDTRAVKARRGPRALPVLLALSALLAAGCAQLKGLLDSDLLGKPGAKVTGASLKGIDLQGVDLVFDVIVNNPYAADLPVLGLDYDIGHGAQSVVKGTSTPGGSIPANGSRALPVAARVNFASLLALAGDIKPGSVVEYVANFGLSTQAPGLGDVRLPAEFVGSFPVPTVPEVVLNSVRWDKLSLTDAAAVLDVGISNGNSFAVDLQQLAYDLKLGGTSVASSTADEPLALAGKQSGTLKLKLSLKPADLGLAAFNMFTGSGATYDLGGRMTLGSAFGPLDLPYAKQGKVAFTKSRRRERREASRA